MKTRYVLGVATLCSVVGLWAVPALAQNDAMGDAKAKAEEMKDKADAMMAQGEEMKGQAKEMMAKGEEMKEKAEGMMGDSGHAMEAEGNEQMAEMMAAWQKAMTPGTPHEELAKWVGTWKMTTTIWNDPSAEPEVHEGVAERSMILGGRVLAPLHLAVVLDARNVEAQALPVVDP